MSDSENNNHHNPAGSGRQAPSEGPHEASTDSMDLVRKRRERMLKHKPTTNAPTLPLSKKIIGIAVIALFITVGYWTFKDEDPLLSDSELPVIVAESDENEVDDFKKAPTEEDIIAAPHGDKTFYNELDQSKKIDSKPAEALRALPEQPAAQISQEALQADLEKDVTPSAEPQTKAARTPETEDLSVAVIDEPAPTSQDVAVAPEKPASSAPSKTLRTPRKTLEMAIRDTTKKVINDSSALAQQDDLQKQDLTVPNAHLRIIQDDAASGKKVVDKGGVAQKSVTTTQSATSARPVVSPVPTKQTAKSSATPPKPKHIKIHKGAYWVQVASLATAETASKEAKRLESRSRTLSSMHKRIVRVDLGKPKGVKHRIQYGPFSKETAVNRCKSLKGNDKIGCFVVRG